VVFFACDQIVDNADQVRFAPGHGHIGDVLAIDDNARHGIDPVAAREVIGALHVGSHREGIVG